MSGAFPPSGVSDEMRTLLDGQKKLHESILKLQQQIEEEEAVYLEETAHGNIIRGWDGFIDSKQSRKDAVLKKVKPYTEAEHLFSTCCSYRTVASEPSIDLVEYNPREETPSIRRRGSMSSIATSGASRATSALKLERKSSFTQTSSGNAASVAAAAAAALAASLGKPPKTKKRRRLDRVEALQTASATHSETGEDDEKEPPSTKKSRDAGDDDFLDLI
ncbi:hypothetical protein Poli38472_004018 [Pythium oligandrum]|uniref:Chromatin modification-related protein MEAF6 n=1 Tax=Pythium oligandrum TaxID=41045 RepID=A0A8K1FQ47_PYTOL|nr:hypothetical protein Poli38472_004018 [Pythium oligandrum]|eukprot:TMW66253.1 hypothetical protein Poli38472_004018 [Pythium oligandrum]